MPGQLRQVAGHSWPRRGRGQIGMRGRVRGRAALRRLRTFLNSQKVHSLRQHPGVLRRQCSGGIPCLQPQQWDGHHHTRIWTIRLGVLQEDTPRHHVARSQGKRHTRSSAACVHQPPKKPGLRWGSCTPFNGQKAWPFVECLPGRLQR